MNWFKNQRTVTKLMLGFGFLAALMGVIGYQGVNGIANVNGLLDTAINKEMPAMVAAQNVEIAALGISRAVRQAMLDTGNQEALRADEQEYNQCSTELASRLQEVERYFDTEPGRSMAAELKKNANEYEASSKDVMNHAVSGDDKTARELIKGARVLIARTLDSVDRTETFKQARVKEFFLQSQASYASTRKFVIGILTAGIAFAIMVGYFISTLISRPLAEMVATAGQLSEGKLDQKILYESRDEPGQLAKAFRQMVEGFSSAVNETADVLGQLAERDLTKRMSGNAKGDFKRIEQAVNKVADNLSHALEEVQNSSQQVTLTAEHLASASQEIASGAQEQAASLEETSATLEQITATVKHNADNARHANQLAVGAREAAEKGGLVMTSAVAAMGAINTASSRIAEIITTIDEIAFQTNLLALNAAVEAARAGEQGRGFAVVASEVRSLAQRSASAAKEIKGLIQDSVRKVENGSELVNDSGRTLNEIVAGVKRVTDIVGEIAAASAQQAAGVEQVSKAMAQMDQVTQTNSAQTEEMSSTAEELSATAESLQQVIGRFVLSSVSDARPSAPVRTAKAGRRKIGQTMKRGSGGALAALAQHTGSSNSEFEEF